mgnify:CR=1 FL=1
MGSALKPCLVEHTSSKFGLPLQGACCARVGRRWQEVIPIFLPCLVSGVRGCLPNTPSWLQTGSVPVSLTRSTPTPLSFQELSRSAEWQKRWQGSARPSSIIRDSNQAIYMLHAGAVPGTCSSSASVAVRCQPSLNVQARHPANPHLYLKCCSLRYKPAAAGPSLRSIPDWPSMLSSLPCIVYKAARD